MKRNFILTEEILEVYGKILHRIKCVEQIKKTHNDNKFAKEYMAIMEVVKIKFNLK
jgi:hypothetical protein